MRLFVMSLSLTVIVVRQRGLQTGMSDPLVGSSPKYGQRLRSDGGSMPFNFGYHSVLEAQVCQA